MGFHVGTSGFSYKEWCGSFYPEKLAPSDMLAFYSERLPAVEINNTFYRMPSRKLLAGWAEKVPDGFSFALKASRRITHQKRLVGAESELEYLLETSTELGDHLGPTLFQLPPYLRKDVDRLDAFAEHLPDDFRAAFEFRHRSWFDDEVFEVLRRRRLALVVADTGGEDDPPLAATAGFGYLRLRREAYEPDELAGWAERVAGQEWSDAWVFFKHEDEGAGPRLAEQFRGLLAAH